MRSLRLHVFPDFEHDPPRHDVKIVMYGGEPGAEVVEFSGRAQFGPGSDWTTVSTFCAAVVKAASRGPIGVAGWIASFEADGALTWLE